MTRTPEPIVSVVIPGHGTYEAPARIVSWVMEDFLPASCETLRAHVEERSEFSWADVTDAMTFLIVLAEFRTGELAHTASVEAPAEDEDSAAEAPTAPVEAPEAEPMGEGATDETGSHWHVCRDCDESFDCEGYESQGGCDTFNGSCPECFQE